MLKRLRALRYRRPVDSPIPYTDPLKAGRHPLQTYMLSLCVVSGLPYLFGEATAEAVEKQLPTWAALAWGLLLLSGSATALIGSFWRGSILNALTLERIGLDVTFGAAFVYGVAILGARDVLAPLCLLVSILGTVLLFVPIPTRWRSRVQVSDVLSLMGLAMIIGGLAGVMITPASVVLVSSFIILGFGFSCLRRARDIQQIFKRALQETSPRVAKEGE